MMREKGSGPACAVATGVAVGVLAMAAAVLFACLQGPRPARAHAGSFRVRGDLRDRDMPGCPRAHAESARVRIVRGPRGERVRVLRQGGVYQGATYLGARRFEPVFEYIRAFDAMFEAEAAMRATSGHGIERVLMLGGGGYSYPKHALTAHSELNMDVVEFDAGITQLARRMFFLDELERRAPDRLRLISADARSFVGRAHEAAERYDAVVNDCFAGVEPVRSLATFEALCQVRGWLRPGGIYLANVVSRAGGEDVGFLRDAAATAAAAFEHVWIVPCVDEVFAGEDNYLLIASDGAYEFAGSIPFDRDFLGEVLRDTPFSR